MIPRVYRSSKAVALHDTNPISPGGLPCGAIIPGTAGNITCRLAGDAADVVIAVLAGVKYDLALTHIRATGTTATNIVALN